MNKKLDENVLSEWNDDPKFKVGTLFNYNRKTYRVTQISKTQSKAICITKSHENEEILLDNKTINRSMMLNN